MPVQFLTCLLVHNSVRSPFLVSLWITKFSPGNVMLFYRYGEKSENRIVGTEKKTLFAHAVASYIWRAQYRQLPKFLFHIYKKTPLSWYSTFIEHMAFHKWTDKSGRLHTFVQFKETLNSIITTTLVSIFKWFCCSAMILFFLRFIVFKLSCV